MKQIITVIDNKRHTKRKMNDALDNNLVKILTELITNSDDSYRRLLKNELINSKLNFKNVIYINLYKKDNKVEVVDNAEGMDCNDVINNFKSYGADKSGRSEGYRIRGLFGQGASDVLFSQKQGKLISIKNNKAISVSFYWDKDEDERKFKIDENLSVDKLREQYDIPNNGTIISFVLTEKTKFPNKVVNKLKNFYMLRFIMNNKDRRIICRQFNDGKLSKEDIIHYEFPPKNEENLLCNEKVSFESDGRIFNADLEIYRVSDKKAKLEKYGELLLLTYDDENNVYDNTFFGLGDRYPGMESLYGYLKLYDTADFIRDKLNAEIAEAILTDSRDGLNKKKDFYKSLSDKIEFFLEAQANKVANNHSLLKSDNFKEHKKMFKELNQYLSEELDEINETGTIIGTKPPIDGFAFVRERMKITVGKKYSLKLLINPLIILNGSIIDLEYGDDNHISVSPKSITVNYDKNAGEIVLYNLLISGNMVTDKDCCLTATIKGGITTKKIFISVISEEVYYPRYGMEFKPDHMSILYDHESKLHLYVDINKYPIGSEIKFNSTNPKIIINEDKIILDKKNVIFENIARVDIVFRSKDSDAFGKIIANCNNFLVEATIETVESLQKNEGRSGLLNGWDFVRSSEVDWQKYFHPKNGKIMINIGHEINKQYFGDKIDVKKFENSLISKKYLAELITDEVAKFMVIKQIDKGQIGKDYEEAIEEHQRRKNKLAEMIYKRIAT